MTDYLTKVRIDTHGKLEGWATEVIDGMTDQPLPNVCKVELVIVPHEPIAAKLTLAHVRHESGQEAQVEHKEVICPDVELSPVLALVQQMAGDAWQIDGNSWNYLDADHLQATFTRRGNE